MNYFLLIFMITLAVATINPDDDLSYGEIVKKYNSLSKESEKCKETITQIQTLISPLSTPGSTTPEPTTPESTTPVTTTPEPITPVTTKLSDEDRDRITRMENKIQMLISPLGTTPTTATTLDQSTPSFTSGTRSQHRVSGDPGGNGFTTTTTTATTLTDEDRDRITRLENKIQMLVSALTTPEPTTPEPTTPEPTTPEPKLSDEERIAHCGVINSMEDESITASSVYGNYHGYGTRHSRLNTRSGGGGWYPGTYEGSWIELNLGKDEVVTAVATQGNWNYGHWTKTFSVSYKSSTSSIFSDVKNQSGEKQIFDGNYDRKTVVINNFTPLLTAQFIRIHPLTWESAPVLRFDVLSC